MVRLCSPLGLAFAVSLALAGCNETNGASGPIASSPLPVHTVAAGGCNAEIERFQAIVMSDRETGNVDPKVFDQIQGELARASQACSAGRSAEAHALVAASKARHGYRA